MHKLANKKEEIMHAEFIEPEKLQFQNNSTRPALKYPPPPERVYFRNQISRLLQSADLIQLRAAADDIVEEN
ncbi:hypothetical protein TSAR_011385 [Trichomalopsis sarcophagae]|uniref:Uncharacterized protein n=1 Tax=Trichomalopsis sarcophagae TaxID=543379 RepID=A0A232EJK5_9HYME|nr:hypothetical protein TSAR_011385 [Trichomalopsis sarcophagae]